MKTKFRTGAIVFATILLGAFGSIPVWILTGVPKAWQLEAGLIATIIIFGVLFIGGVTGIVWLALQIDIDVTNDRVSFRYPFRFQTFSYRLSEIVGFRFKHLNARIDYKSLQFRTKPDKRTFSISDFETANLRDIERLALERFELRAGKDFVTLTQKQKETEIEMSAAFDRVQAGEIRFYLGLLALSIATVLSYLIYQMVMGEAKDPMVVTISLAAMLPAEYFAIRRFREAHEKLKNIGKQ